jgi:hypothetical protein
LRRARPSNATNAVLLKGIHQRFTIMERARIQAR